MLATCALLGLGWLSSSLAQTDNGGEFTCVAGADTAWRCSKDGSAPQAAELPELVEALPGPGRQVGKPNFPMPNPGRDNGQMTSAVNNLLPPPSRARPDLYTLKIASVSAIDEIPSFVESYGLDPALVRYMEIMEGDSSRQLILWGRFASPAQASRAMVAMPAAVQAIHPQMAEIASLDAPIKDYQTLLRQPAVAAAADPIPAPAVAVRIPPSPTPTSTAEALENRPSTASTPAAAEPAQKLEPRIAAAGSTSSTAPKPGLEVGSQPAPKPAAAQSPAPPAQRPKPDTVARTDPKNRATASTVASEIASETATPAPSNPGRSNAVSPTSSTPPAATQADSTSVQTAPAPAGDEALLALGDNDFVIQLTSLSKPALLPLYLRRHQIAAKELMAVTLDEGAGPRVLLLKGGYNSFSSAEAAMAELPDSIRSPWIRTVAPLRSALQQR